MNGDQNQIASLAACVDHTEEHPPIMVGFAPNWPMRVVFFRCVGTALILVASGLWLMPGFRGDGIQMLVQFGTSGFFFLCGLVLLMRNHEDNQPDAYFDPIRHELRVLQMNDSSRPETILRRSYDSLGRIDFNENMVEIFDADGGRMMRLIVDDQDVRRSLRTQLSGLIDVTG